MTSSADLSVNVILPNIRRVLQRVSRLVVQAPPGAGKTTGIPLALIDEPWLDGCKIIMLEPRRLAARAAARRMADMSGERPGRTIGYRTRLDSCAGPHTRIEVITDGILTRMLQADPELSGVGLVIFDEFHERSLLADLGLALLLDAQSALRPDMRILIMSATLDATALGHVLQAEVLSAEGRCFEVITHYRERPLQNTLDRDIAQEVLRALRSEQGSVLVFLPGAAEIRRTAGLLTGSVPADVHVVPLYGNLSRADQDRAIAPAAPGTRKVVLATSIAETSLTIEGVRVVIDCGLARVPRYDPGVDMTRLATLPVSRAGADQRRGRAGRSGPGVCFRLWTREQDTSLPEQYEPEIKNADLAACALELALWGVADPEQLFWITPPPAGAFQRGRTLLRRLGALDAQGRITTDGRRMAGMGLHPRLAYMVCRGVDLGLGALACDLAALLSERDVLRFPAGSYDADIRLRLEALCGSAARQQGVDAADCRNVLDVSGRLKKQLGINTQSSYEIDNAGVLLAHAYPDRIAQKRSGTEYQLACGRGAFFLNVDTLCTHEYLAVATLDGSAQRARIFLAAPLDRDQILRYFEPHITDAERLSWDAQTRSVAAERLQLLDQLVLRRVPWQKPDPVRVRRALLDGITSLGIACLPWTDELRQWQARVMLLRSVSGVETWPDVSDRYLAAHGEHWLEPFLGNARRLDQVSSRDLQTALSALLPPGGQATLDRFAPRTTELPGGRRVRLHYPEDGGPPVLSARIQDLFGMRDVPPVADGRVRVLVHLLSPAMRPVQITSDMDGFWKNSYHAVKKELKGRYPKHSWPDDPLNVPVGRRPQKK
jgi:ATP-dependent helicase HrpB